MEETKPTPSSPKTPLVNLSALKTNALLFHYLDVLPRHATFACRSMQTQVTIHKIVTNGGKKERTVYAPSRLLRWIQTRIRETMLLRIPQPDYVTGFVPGRGIVYNAKKHVGARTVVNIDLKNFFPTITPARVYGLLKSTFGLESSPCATLTNLVTYQGHLCQGFVTSPDIANIICWHMDRRLARLAEKSGLVFTRYADDLTFSGGDWHGSVDKFIDIVREIVSSEGFEVHPEKIAIMRRGRRQRVTGVVVSQNGTIGVDMRMRKILRAACHHWPQQTEDRRRQIMGWRSYVMSINPAHAAELDRMIEKAQKTENWSRGVPHGSFSLDLGRPE